MKKMDEKMMKRSLLEGFLKRISMSFEDFQ